MEPLSKDELIHHLLRLTGNGEPYAARNVQRLVRVQAKKLRLAGREEEAIRLEVGLAASGHQPKASDVFRMEEA